MTTYKEQKKKVFAAIVLLIFFASFVLPGGALGLDLDNPYDEDGFAVEVKVVQSSPVPTAQPEKPAKVRNYGQLIYVQPHWVNGGYGVEILQPGYWTGTENEARR